MARSRIAHAFRRTALPLTCYYAVALGLPIANGAWRSGTLLVKHALFVLAVPPIVIAFACAAHGSSQALTGLVRSAVGRFKWP
jgi:hypothetical protein